jgi:hypothetical protein
MFVIILFSVEVAEMKAFRTLPRKLKSLFLQAKNLDQIDKLFLLRRLMIFIYSWIISPLVLNRLPELLAILIMFSYVTIVTFVFLKLTKHSEEKSILLRFVNFVFRNKRLLSTIALCPLEPYLFAVRCKNIHTRKFKKIWILPVILSLLFTTLGWVIFVKITGIKI